MDVYYDKNFWYRKNEGQEGVSPLKKISVDAPFCWKDIEGFLPALYVGSEGAVLDVCIRVPFPEIERYFGRWTEEKRLSGLTDEEFEEMQSDSPFPSDFRIEMGLDGEELTSGSMCSTVWHTYKAEEQYADEEAEALMEEYGCDRGAGWMFTRWNYGWSGQPVLTPERMTLSFRADRQPVTAGYFITAEGAEGETHEITDPDSGETYVLTVRTCSNEMMDEEMKRTLDQEMEYPSFYQVIAWDAEPEILKDELQIQDCSRGDAPRWKDSGKRNGAVSVAVMCSEKLPGDMTADPSGEQQKILRTACSSLHFEPVEEVRWRAVFLRRRRGDMTMEIEL